MKQKEQKRKGKRRWKSGLYGRKKDRLIKDKNEEGKRKNDGKWMVGRKERKAERRRIKMTRGKEDGK